VCEKLPTRKYVEKAEHIDGNDGSNIVYNSDPKRYLGHETPV